MASKLKVDLPEFVRLFPPTNLDNYGTYIRVRSIQMKGKCCGVALSMDDMHDIIALCARDTVRDKASYLGKMLSRFQINATLRHIYSNRKLRVDERIRAVAKYVRGLTSWQLKAIWGFIEKKYSLADIIDMCELCNRKEKPGAYMLGILKKGFTRRAS